jgi:hypothetical protein
LTKALVALLAIGSLGVGACSGDRKTLAVEGLKLDACPPIRAMAVTDGLLFTEIRTVAGGKIGRRLNGAPQGANPIASPDGRSIAYEAGASFSDGLGLLQDGVNIVGVNGDNDHVLTPGHFYLVAWKDAGIVAKRWSEPEALVVIDPRTGSPRTVWEAAARIEVIGWSGAATAIATTNVGTHTELWTVDVSTGRSRRRYEAEGTVIPSRDLRQVAVSRQVTPADFAIFAGPLDATLTEVPRTRPGFAQPIGWTNDGWLLIFKNRRGPHDRVHAFRNGVERPVLTEIRDQDPRYYRLLDRLSCATLHADGYLK